LAPCDLTHNPSPYEGEGGHAFKKDNIISFSFIRRRCLPKFFLKFRQADEVGGSLVEHIKE